MALEKDIILSDGTPVRMRASALIPRLYRVKFGRDMIRDLSKLQGSIASVKTGGKEDLDAVDLTIFENLAWLMAHHADPENVPNDPDEWLATLPHIMDIYEAMPQMMDLLSANTATTSVPAKK